MVQVKEFLNYQKSQDSEINKWLKENNVDIIDIKYSVGAFQSDNQEYSGVLVVYKEKENGHKGINYEDYKPDWMCK